MICDFFKFLGNKISSPWHSFGGTMYNCSGQIHSSKKNYNLTQKLKILLKSNMLESKNYCTVTVVIIQHRPQLEVWHKYPSVQSRFTV